MQPNLLAAVTSDNPLHKSLYALTNEGETSSPPSHYFMITEDDKFMLSENNFNLITE